MAFWFKSRDSVNRAAALRLLSVVIMGFSLCHCLPVSTDASNEPWWCQPCNRDREHRTRHSRGINDPLRNTFEIAITRYETNISKYVKQLHNKLQIGNMPKKQFRKNTWLPRKKFFKKLEEKNKEKILPELHYQIQVYAVTIQRLLNMEIRSQDASFDASSRTNTLNIVKSDINLLRCETEQEIAEKELEEPKRVQANFVDNKIPSGVDHLQDGLLMDYSILKDYYNFLKKCYVKIFGKLKRPRKNKQGKKNKQQKKKRTPKKDAEKAES